MMKKIFSEKVFNVFNITMMLLLVLLCVYPFYYMLIYSVSHADKAHSLTILPVGFTLTNYMKVFQLSGFGRAAIVSISRTVLGTTCTVGCCAFFGYLMTKQRMKFRKFFYRMLIITMYVDGGLVSTFLVMNAYGMVNSYLLYIIPTLISAYNVMLIKTFVEQLPASLEESAMIDGAGPVRCWWSIVMPLMKPILATIAVFAAVGQWNAWFDAHIYITDKSKWTLQYILYRYLQQVNWLTQMMEESGMETMGESMVTPQALRMTITAVVTIPILFVYPFMQKYFMKGMLLGAVKG